MPQNSSSENNTLDYDSVFEKLVVNTPEGSPERLIGVLAYAKYKLDGHKWLKKNPNALPEQKKIFLDIHDDEEKLEEYRHGAEESFVDLIVKFTEVRLKEKLRDLTDKIDQTKDNLTNEIKQTKVKFMLPVWQSLLASVIFTIALFIIALTIRVAAPNSSIGQLIQYLSATDSYELKVIEKKKN